MPAPNYRVTARLGERSVTYILHADEAGSRDEAMHVVTNRLKIFRTAAWRAASLEVEETSDRRL